MDRKRREIICFFVFILDFVEGWGRKEGIVFIW